MSDRILVVDDERNIRLTVAAALERDDRAIDCAANGEDALAQLCEQAYDLMLLDLKMPGIDGLEVLRRLRAGGAELPVIVITAFGTVAAAVDAMKLGAADFIEKPFSPKAVRAVVDEVLDRRQLGPRPTSDYVHEVQLAKRCVQSRDFASAEMHARQALALDPERAEAHNLLGAVQEVMGREEDAQRNYRAALALDPSYRPAQANLERATSWMPRGGVVMDEDDSPGKVGS